MTQDIKRRKRYFIDAPVQGALLLRAGRYWLMSLVMVAGMTLLGWLFVWPGVPVVIDEWAQWRPVLNVMAVGAAATLLLLPVVLYDLLKLTNRFTGPIYRLRRALTDLADGKPVAPIKFRRDDYWQELALAFNRIVAQRVAAADTAGQHEPERAEELAGVG